MTEWSKGKARPSLPRASDLSVPPEPLPTAGRGPGGRFAPGNRVGEGKGWKVATAKVMGRESDDPIVTLVVRDGYMIFAGIMREMPHDGPLVRGLCASLARCRALEGFWTAEATSKGLTSAEGILAQEQAIKFGQRAERLAVTALDVATKLAQSTRKRRGSVSTIDAIRARAATLVASETKEDPT